MDDSFLYDGRQHWLAERWRGGVPSRTRLVRQVFDPMECAAQGDVFARLEELPAPRPLDLAVPVTTSADVADDIAQIARIRLWELDPSRFDDSDEAWVADELGRVMGAGRLKYRRSAG